MKKIQKSIISLLMIMAMTGALMGCSADKKGETEQTTATPTVTESVTEPDKETTPAPTETPEYFIPEDFDPATVAGKKLIAITVDDGPDGAGTKGYIDAAKEFGAPLTFFVIGKNIPSNSAQLEEMLKAGCEIGNHSYSHGYLTEKDASVIKDEIQKTNDLIMQYAPGATVSFVRAPYFAYDNAVYENVGYPLIDAALTESGNNYEATLEVLMGAKDGDIVLMHASNSGSLEALREAIPKLTADGFAFITVSQLFEARGLEAIDGTVYRSVGKNILNDYEVSENLFTGENSASGDWSNWETAVELGKDKAVAMTEGTAIKVEYKATAGPCLILSSWTGGPNWIQLTPSFDTGATAVFTYDDIIAAYGEALTSVDSVLVRPYGADLTVTSVDMLVQK